MNKILNAKDEMIKICQTIWSCRNAEQLDGAKNMLKNYIQKHGDDNLGIVFIEIELKRQERLNGLMKKVMNLK